MTTTPHRPDTPSDCARYEAQLGPWMDQELGAADQAFMLRHRAGCQACDTLSRELEQLVADAASLPPVAPARDLWPEIEARLTTPVVPIVSPAAQASTSPPAKARTISLRRFAVAATLLVSATAAVTWQLAQSRARTTGLTASSTATRPDSTAIGDELPAATEELAVGSPAAGSTMGTTPTRAVSRRSDNADAPDANTTYEREIGTLRSIVEERFAELDTATVRELQRNLDIIDRAIADSKAALASDPRNSVGSSQLDRALQAKLDLLRRVALL